MQRDNIQRALHIKSRWIQIRGENVEILETIKDYWVMITFFLGELGVVWIFVNNITEGLKCTLRNDILEIYDNCKEKREITKYQLQCINYSFEVYTRFKGNSFVEEIVKEVRRYKIID